MANTFMMIPSISVIANGIDWLENTITNANLQDSRKPSLVQIKAVVNEIGWLIKNESINDWKDGEGQFELEVFVGDSFLFEMSAYPKSDNQELEVLFLGKHGHNPLAQLIFVHEVSKRFGSQVFYCDAGGTILVEPEFDIESLKKLFIEKFEDM
ncbi:MAG: hypothetical protein GC192_14095 [Bacteroidetes bacterium]|nr:hypothetical protein [Bacteroidota bacterium]